MNTWRAFTSSWHQDRFDCYAIAIASLAGAHRSVLFSIWKTHHSRQKKHLKIFDKKKNG